MRGRSATGSWSSCRPAVSGRGISNSGIRTAARTWFDRAAEIASESPTPPRARQLELWRGLLHAAEGDVEETRKHLEHAVELAARQGMPAERCETLAASALAFAALGSELADEELLAAAERAATDAKELLPLLPGHAPWGARADAALARVALARGDAELAATHARAAVAALQEARHEDMNLDVLLPVAEAFAAGGSDDERAGIVAYLRSQAAVIANRIADEDVRSRWFRAPIGSALAALAEPGTSFTRASRRTRWRASTRPTRSFSGSSSRASRTRRSLNGSGSPRSTSPGA